MKPLVIRNEYILEKRFKLGQINKQISEIMFPIKEEATTGTAKNEFELMFPVKPEAVSQVAKKQFSNELLSKGLTHPRIGLDDFIVPKEVYAEKMNLNQELVQKAAQKIASINEKNAEQALIEHQAKKIERYKLDTGRALRDLKAGNIEQAIQYLEALQHG